MDFIYTEQYDIHSYEADYKGNASVLSLCNFLQEIAWQHAEHMELGYSHLISKDLIWIMLRQSFNIKKYPVWGDKVKVNTWPSGKDKLYCYRQFEILNSNNEVLANAIFTWMVIDVNSKRPQRTDVYFSVNLPEKFNKIPELLPPKINKEVNGELIRTIDVTVSDIDVNNHVNNVTYIKWILDSFPLEFHDKFSLKSFNSNFIAEAVYGDTIEIHAEEINESSHKVAIIRKSDNKQLYLAELTWSKSV